MTQSQSYKQKAPSFANLSHKNRCIRFDFTYTSIFMPANSSCTPLFYCKTGPENLSISLSFYRMKCVATRSAFSGRPNISLPNAILFISFLSCDSLLHPASFRFIQLLHQRIFKNGKSRNKTITYQQNHFVHFILIVYMDRSISLF